MGLEDAQGKQVGQHPRPGAPPYHGSKTLGGVEEEWKEGGVEALNIDPFAMSLPN